MSALTIIFASLAALLHVLFFVLESVLFRRATVWGRFGVKSQADAETIAPMAYNQGFYNLFLALGVVVGLVLGNEDAGKGIVIFACACMVGAALVLVTNNVKLARSAAIQGIAPLIAIIGAFL
ncbi:DUF1304 domain-containing protein [Nakamurella silvestris]|nr:DUF1304 domain-containing protein [Nakamurella silvestris]